MESQQLDNILRAKIAHALQGENVDTHISAAYQNPVARAVQKECSQSKKGPWGSLFTVLLVLAAIAALVFFLHK